MRRRVGCILLVLGLAIAGCAQAPTVVPTSAPTTIPTQVPTAAPTAAPTAEPTSAPAPVADGLSQAGAAPAGTVVAGLIECGEGYTSHELYDVKITLEEVLRGDKAWRSIQAASASSQPASAWTEYVLARIRFEYAARGAPGDCRFAVTGATQFEALSADGKSYQAAAVALPGPELSGDVGSGESLEGWVAFAVAQTDSKPLMTFNANPAGGVTLGGGMWFQLY